MEKPIIIKDTQEKEGHGWWWDECDWCAGTVRQSLKTGDYSLEGYQHIFTIERKGSIAEFAKNIVEGRFDREIQRMSTIPHSFILLEFNMSDLINFPRSAHIPRNILKSVKITGRYILRRISEIMIQYSNIKILFVSKYGQEVARSLIKRIIENA